jgi:hypothetical protein
MINDTPIYYFFPKIEYAMVIINDTMDSNAIQEYTYTDLPRELRLVIITHNTYRMGELRPKNAYFGYFKDDPTKQHYLFFVPKSLWCNFVIRFGKSFKCYHNIKTTVSPQNLHRDTNKHMVKSICDNSNWRIKLDANRGGAHICNYIGYFAGTNTRFTIVYKSEYLYKCACTNIIRLMDLGL